MKSAIRQLMIGSSSYCNHFVAAKLPNACKFILVCEFPRSGGTWIRDMIGDVLQLPVPRYSLFPVTFQSLVHSHFVIPVNKTPVVYVVRDARDVFVSHYYKARNSVINGTAAQAKRVLKFHPSLNIFMGDSEINDKLSEFYEEWRRRPVGSGVNWGDHVKAWLERKSSNVNLVRYEDMRGDPVSALRTITSCLAEGGIDDEIIRFAVKRNSFENKTGRISGNEDNNANRRSGRVGGWRDSLSNELQSKFLQDFGRSLEIAGYE